MSQLLIRHRAPLINAARSKLTQAQQSSLGQRERTVLAHLPIPERLDSVAECVGET
jgi:hypothetical protein